MIVFVAFNFYNKYLFDKAEKLKQDGIKYNRQKSTVSSQRILDNGYFRTKEKTGMKGKKVKVVSSKYMILGYTTMLFFRLMFEIFCLYLEFQLAKHHSQNEDPSLWLKLKEKWLCNTNDHTQELGNSLNEVLPVNNRSKVFHRDDVVQACRIQVPTVTCWISFSRMKSLGIQLMVGVMSVQIIMTFLELMVEVCKMCMGESGLRKPKDY